MTTMSNEAKGRALKLATGQLVTAIGGMEAAAALLDRSKSTVHRWTDRNDAEHFASVRDAVRLEELAGRADVTALLCKLAGGLFVPYLDMTADEGSPAWLAMQLAQRLGQVSGEIACGLADDNRIDAGEARRALEELDRHDRVSAQLRAVLTAIIAAELN